VGAAIGQPCGTSARLGGTHGTSADVRGPRFKSKRLAAAPRARNRGPCRGPSEGDEAIRRRALATARPIAGGQGG
jgi:hypothetical protein